MNKSSCKKKSMYLCENDSVVVHSLFEPEPEP